MSDTVSIHPALRASRGMSELTAQILDRRLYAVLATQNDDGTVHLAPVMFLYTDGRILIETAAATRKARNIAARPAASVLVQTPEASWALGAGPAAIVHGTEAARLNEKLRAKYLTPRVNEPAATSSASSTTSPSPSRLQAGSAGTSALS